MADRHDVTAPDGCGPAAMAHAELPDRQTRNELTRMLYRNHWGIYPMAVAGALLVALLFHEAIPAWALWVFLLWTLLSESLRAGAHLLFHRYARTSSGAPELAHRWDRIFKLLTLLYAGSWGFAGLFLFAPGQPLHQVTLTMLIISVNAVTSFTLSGHPGFTRLFLAVTTLPLVASLLTDWGEYTLVLLAILLVVVALLLMTSQWTGRELRELLGLRFAYSNLARELSDEIAAREQTQDRLRQLTDHDQLTGLLSHKGFCDVLSQEPRQPASEGETRALLVIDIARFKTINESLGLRAGDRILKIMARRLAASLGDSELAARQSGDEFLMFCRSSRGLEEISARVETLIRKLNLPIPLDVEGLRIDCSIGVACYPEDGESPEVLIQHADIAMERAKQIGPNQYQFFQPDMHKRVHRRLARETALRRALYADRLHLNFQPQVDAASGRIVGAEALVRWTDPEHGHISPGDFIPLAEETGLIIPLGKWVLRETCRQARTWPGFAGGDFHVSANLSVGQFDSGDLVNTVATTLEETGLKPENLVLEITESLIMRDPVHHVALLNELKQLGLRLALDDFGTGYSSMSYLRQLPLDILKLDRQFINNVEHSEKDAIIAGATIWMARELGMEVVAEGVESVEQIHWLLNQDCHMMQGFFFSHPLSGEEIRALWRTPRDTLAERWKIG